jgi:NADPH-dependent 2,4-dienoyl-CoA reductase/sulfur reductase-like enzyme/nitrite reductase/ring-hydroxylating ferredoxin subunit
MEETAWRRAARESDLVEGVPVLAKAGEENVLLVRFEGVVRAFGHECPHHNDPLEKGALIKGELVCPGHYARFSARDGKLSAPPALDDLPTYPVKVEAGEILVGQVVKPRRPAVGEGDPRTLLIVGAGAAGNAAAETLRREGFSGRVVMVTAEDELPYDRPELSKGYLTGKTKPEWIPLRSPKFFAGQKIEVLTGRRVAGLDTRRKTVALESGETLAFDKVLLATGGTPRRPRESRAGGASCFSLRSLADARVIAAALEHARSVVIIGAGFIGMELAGSLCERGLGVDVVTPDSLPFAHIFGERIAGLLMGRHQQRGVAFHLGRTPTRITGGEGAKSVVLSDGTRLEAGLVVFGIGVAPAVDFLAGTGLAQAGGVAVDGRLATAHPDVFAAGDIAIVPGPTGGEPERIEHWVVAERQGRHAARSMLGGTAAFDECPFFWTRQAGVSLKVAGSTRGFDDVVFRGDVEGARFLAGFYRRGTLRAAVTSGMVAEHIAVERALAAGTSISPRQFADVGFSPGSVL